MLRGHFRRLVLMFVLQLLLLSGCRKCEEYRYTVPEVTNDGWQTATLSSAYVAAEPIHELFNRIKDNTYKNIHAVLVVKNGKLVVEEYFPGPDSNGKYRVFQRDTLHETCSITKCVNSILIGILIDQRLIKTVDEKISTLLPPYSDVFADAKKDAIYLNHL